MGNNNVKDYQPYLDYPKPYKPQTNADRIRAMRDEELAGLISELSDCAACKCDAKHPKCAVSDESCKNTWMDWLKEEVTDDVL